MKHTRMGMVISLVALFIVFSREVASLTVCRFLSIVTSIKSLVKLNQKILQLAEMANFFTQTRPLSQLQWRSDSQYGDSFYSGNLGLLVT